MRGLVTISLAGALVGTAFADPPAGVPPKPQQPLQQQPQQSQPRPPRSGIANVGPWLVLDVPPPPVLSLRLEAVRVAGERVEGDWRYPEPGLVFGYDQAGWFLGHSHYRPRTARSAALHGGSMASTLLGEILLSAHSPVAGVGALLTGATLDAAAADVDRDAEAKKPR